MCWVCAGKAMVGAEAALRMGGLGGTIVPSATEEMLSPVDSASDMTLAAVRLALRVVRVFRR